MALEKAEDNYVSLSAGFDGNEAYFYYEKAVDGNVAIMTMFVVHRITGPLSRVREIMHEIGKGFIPPRVKFRKGDEFQDIAEAMDRAVTRIEEDTGNNLKVIKEASDCLRRGSEWLNSEKPQVQRLKEELEHLRKCLERFKIFQKQLGE